MKYRITGADRETGEDVELGIEAQNQPEALAKANRRGIMVATCAEAKPQKSVPKTAPPPPSSASEVNVKTSSRSRWFLLKVAAVILIVVGLAVGAYYRFVFLPQWEQTRKTLDDAVVQSEKTVKMVAEQNERQQRMLNLRIMAEEARGGGSNAEAFQNKLTNDGKLYLRAAVANDPIVAPIAKDHPDLIDAIKSADQLALWSFLKALPKDEISSEDSAYLTVFGKTLASWPDQ